MKLLHLEVVDRYAHGFLYKLSFNVGEHPTGELFEKASVHGFSQILSLWIGCTPEEGKWLLDNCPGGTLRRALDEWGTRLFSPVHLCKELGLVERVHKTCLPSTTEAVVYPSGDALYIKHKQVAQACLSILTELVEESRRRLEDAVLQPIAPQGTTLSDEAEEWCRYFNSIQEEG